MINCDVTACGVITRAAEVKKKDDESTFISFSIKIDLKGRDGSEFPLFINVSSKGGESDIAQFSKGKKVTVHGRLKFRQKGDKLYLNLRASDDIELSDSEKEVKIEGKISFWGKIGAKGVGTFLDKKNRNYKSFSAFSQTKEGENTEFLWFRFMYFHPKKEDDSILVANKYVEIHGDLQLSSYNSKLSTDCRVESVKEWIMKKNQQESKTSA